MYGQEGDSTYIKQFLNKADYSEIDTVFYEKKYRFNRLKEEGWRVIENITKESKIIRETSGLEGYTGEYNLGVWKFYKFGKLNRIDTNSFVNQSFISKEYYYYYYWKNGNLKCYFFDKIDYNHEDAPKIRSGNINDWKFPGDSRYFYYNRKGELKEKYIYKNNELIEKMKY